MAGDTIFVFSLLGIASILFASGRVRLDIVALLVVLALALSGTLSVREALSGFGDPVVILVAGLLIVGESITRTGIAHSIGNWIAQRAGESETRLLVLLMLAAAVLGSIMSSTAVVAIFIPIVLNIAGKTNLNASRLLIPLSFGALISGMLTLIATTPNIVVSEELADAGFKPFSFFSFTPIGLGALAVAIVYFLLLGRRLLPGGKESPPKDVVRGMRDLMGEYGISPDDNWWFRVRAGSSMAGRRLGDLDLSREYAARVVGLERVERFGSSIRAAPGPEVVLRAGDVIALQAPPESLARLVDENNLERTPIGERDIARWIRELGLATVLIHPESGMIGSTLRESNLRSRYGVHVLGVRHKGEVLADYQERKLQAGDALLVLGPWKKIGALQATTHDFLVLALPVEMKEVAPARAQAPAAVAILLGMVVLSAFEIVPVVMAVLLAAMAVIFTRILSMQEAYRVMNWSSLVLIAGMLPIAKALDRTGGVDLIVDGMISGVGDAGPYAMMTAIFFVSAGLGLFLSNTATAVLMAPIAIAAAEALKVEPYAFAMTVAIAASAAFATPVSTPVVTLVVEPGRYRFLDFVKVGVPMLILTWIVTLLVTPLVFPF
ncbi:MAG: SLC13 family permease [Planctomycetota bacterium]